MLTGRAVLSNAAHTLGVPQVAVRHGLTVVSHHRPTGCSTGRRSKIGDKLTVDYTGWLCTGGVSNLRKQPHSCTKGSQFDTTKGRGPFDLILGTTPVILGWEAGMQGTFSSSHTHQRLLNLLLTGMCQGEVRRLIIPPFQGYGKAGTSGIPGGSRLVRAHQISAHHNFHHSADI